MLRDFGKMRVRVGIELFLQSLSIGSWVISMTPVRPRAGSAWTRETCEQQKDREHDQRDSKPFHVNSSKNANCTMRFRQCAGRSTAPHYLVPTMPPIASIPKAQYRMH
jgi:hypothetical protein